MRILFLTVLVFSFFISHNVVAAPKSDSSGGEGKSLNIKQLSRNRALLKDHFLKGYKSWNGSGDWYKIDPPISQSRDKKYENSVIGKAESLINGIYINYDEQIRINDMILSEVRIASKVQESTKVNYSVLSSKLSMAAQYYKELSDSLKTGNFNKTKVFPSGLPSSGHAVSNLPELQKKKAVIWFDPREKIWVLLYFNEVDIQKLVIQVSRLADYLQDAAARVVKYIHEIYYLGISEKTIISVDKVISFVVRPPGDTGLKDAGISGMGEAELRGRMFLNFLANNLKEVKRANYRIVKKEEKAIEVTTTRIKENLPNTFIIKDDHGVVRSQIKRQGYSSGIYLDKPGKDYDLNLFREELRVRFLKRSFSFSDQVYRQELTAPFWDINRIRLRKSSWRLRGGMFFQKGDRFIESRISENFMPVEGIIIGMGLGVNASLLGIGVLPSLLPAGQTAAITSLVGGSATVLTGGVVLAAIVVGASVQYFFHLQEIKTEKARIKYLLESVERDLAKRMRE